MHQPVNYDLGKGIIAFTTDRTIGREPDKVRAFVMQRIREAGSAGDFMPSGTLRFARPHQTHGDRILPLAEEFFALSEATRRMLLDGVDAVMTDVPETILGVSTADCIPVLVYDPGHHAAAAIHAGWRGTLQRIVQKTMVAMSRSYGTVPEQCRAAIGPGISLDSFEVGDEVYSAFAEAAFPMGGVARRYPVMDNPKSLPLATKQPNNQTTKPPNHQTTKPLNHQTTKQPTPKKWHIDLKEINRQQLLSAGLPEENILVSDIDTFTDLRFFSARREQHGTQKCGRNFSAFVLGGRR